MIWCGNGSLREFTYSDTVPYGWGTVATAMRRLTLAASDAEQRVVIFGVGCPLKPCLIANRQCYTVRRR